MKTVSASSLLIVLENPDSSLIGQLSPLVEEIKTAQKQAGMKELIIDIDTDDDFLVNGEYSYSGSFPIVQTFVGKVYLDAINSLTFEPLKGKEYKLERFLEYIHALGVSSDLATYGKVVLGGNQVLSAHINTHPHSIQFGSVLVDLKA